MYLKTGGGAGKMTWWYPLIRAAKSLGVAPWDLAAQPICWQDWALMADAAFDTAVAEMRKHSY